MSNDQPPRAMDLARWANEQRYHQGFSERMARQAESVLRAAVEAERARIEEIIRKCADQGWLSWDTAQEIIQRARRKETP